MESSVEFSQSFNPLLEKAISGYQGMARSTAINDTYRKTINKFVSRAMMDDEHQNLPSAMRSAIRELTEQGIKTIDYTSGHASRMDSAVRNAMTTEFTQIVQEVQRKLGEDIGTDGVEISAHEHCAVDHEPLQGHTFTNEEYEKLQNGDAAEDIEGEVFQIDRSIGMWNCRHIAFPVIIGISEPSFSPEELEEIKERNEAGVEYQGEHYTLYEAEQEQRRIETQMRHEKERLELLKELKDTDPLIQAEYNRTRRRLAELSGEYKELGAALEPMAIRMKADRASIPRVTTPVKIQEDMPQKYVNAFSSDNEAMDKLMAETYGSLSEENRRLLNSIIGDEKLFKLLPEDSSEGNSWVHDMIQLKESTLEMFSKGGENPLMHEMGHMLDEKLTEILGKLHVSSGFGKKWGELKSVIFEDWFNLVATHGNVDNLRNFVLEESKNNPYKYDAITDMIGILSGRPLPGRLGHPEEYCQNVFVNPHDREGFAHVFVASNYKEKMELFNIYFPNAVKWYNRLMKILIKELGT